MSGTEVSERIPLARAEELAHEIIQDLRPACERIEVAGSIRRKSPTVGDIEIIAIPKFDEVPTGLFGDIESVNLLDQAVINQLHGYETPYGMRLDKNGRSAVGSKYKRLTFRGIALDLFIVTPPGQWGVLMAIRTGPANYSHRFVSHDVVQLEDGTRGTLPFHMRVQDGQLWSRGKLVNTPTEESFFKAIGLPYLEPWERK